MSLWRYAYALVGAAGIIALAAFNLVGPWTTGDWAALTFALMADIVSIAGLAPAVECHRNRQPALAIVCAALLLGAGYLEIQGAAGWLRVNTHKAESTGAAQMESATDAKMERDAAITRRDAIDAKLLTERKASLIASLKEQRKEAQAEVERLAPQTHTANIERVAGAVYGNELQLAAAAWFVCQLLLFVAIGARDGAGVMPVRNGAFRAVSGVSRGTVDLFPDGDGDGPRGTGNHIDDTSEKRVSAPLTQQTVSPVRPVLTVVPKDEEREQIFDLSRAGFSVRQIAKRLDCSPSKVQRVLKPKSQDTTRDRADA